jgi:poly(3-hydroxybutyrate) depolymerase
MNTMAMLKHAALWLGLAVAGCGGSGDGGGQDAGPDEGFEIPEVADDRAPQDPLAEDGPEAEADADGPDLDAPADEADGDDAADATDTTWDLPDDAPYDCGPKGVVTRSVAYSGSSVDYWLFVPSACESRRPIPVLLAFHGSGDSAANYINIWTAVAERDTFIVVAQEGEDRMGWGSASDVPVLNLIMEDLAAAYDVDENRLYCTGFSAGGHWTYILGLMNADVFAALGVQAGSMSYVMSSPGWQDMILRPIPVDIHHGRSDPVVPFSEAELARDTLSSLGHTVFFQPFDGGHTTSAGHAAEIWANIGGLSL